MLATCILTNSCDCDCTNCDHWVQIETSLHIDFVQL